MGLKSSISFFYLSFLTFLHFCQTASTPATWVTDPRFVSGTFSYNPITSGLLSDSVVITYTNPMSGATRLVALGIVDFQFRFSTTAFNFTAIFAGMENWGFQADILTNVGSDINNLKLAYLTVDPLFTSAFSISYFTTTTSTPEQGPFSLTYYINFTASTGVILNLANSNAMLAFQLIIDVTSPTKCFQMDIVFRIFNQSFYQVVASTSCNLQMSKFGFSRIIFDKTQIEALGECFFQFGELQASNSNDNSLTFSTSPFYSANFMMGMKCFNANGFTKLKFSTALGTTTSVTSNQFVYLSFMYWSFKKRVCPAGFPYFQISTALCFDTCPDGTYSDSTLYICPSCSYTCLTCSSFSVCTNCDPVTNRYLNGTTCPPNPGFFDNSTANAISCNTALPQCLDCTDQFTCINCSTGYYIDVNNTCQPCNSAIVNCTECSSATGTIICTQCDNGLVLSADGLTCAAPPCTDPNCIACVANLSICQNCSSGYTISADFTCIGVCGDGIVVLTQQCDDGNSYYGDGCTPNCTIQNNTCPSATPFIDPATGICIASCPSQFYNNLNTSCLPCFYTCDSCTASPDCTSCSAANHRTLNGTLCQPEPNYYDNGTVDALPCVSPCITCSSASNCLTCQSGYYLSSSSCILCSIAFAFCSRCDVAGSTCTLCQAGYIWNTTTNVCDVVPCADTNCLSCPSSFISCTLCVPGYNPIGGNCVTVCGDFYVTPNEVCDDGNSINKDGCSNTCQLQADFQCETTANNNTGSACYFTGQVRVQQVYINKVDGQNKIQILLDLFPSELPVWDQVNFMDMIQLNCPVQISGYQIVRNPDGTVSITVEYAEDIQGQTISLSINPNNTGNPALQRAQLSTVNLLINPDDNQGAYFYDESTYKLASIISTLCSAVSALAALLFVVGLVAGKMIGVEMMAVIQISFFSLLTLSQVNPCFSALSSLHFINGYNSLNNNPLKDELTPTQPKGIFLFSRFTQNFNLTLAIVIVPLLISLISFILYKTAFKDNQRLLNVARKSVGQYTLMGLAFAGYITSVSFALQLMYGLKKTGDFIGTVSVAECAILLLTMAGYFVFLVLKPDFFGEFTSQFKREVLPQKYYNIMLVERLLVGSCLVFLLATSFGTAIPIAAFVILGVFVAIKKPYKENYQNYRAIANMSIATSIQAIYLSYSLINPEQKNSPIFFYLPLIILGLLIVCICYSGVAIVYYLYKTCTQEKNAIQQIKQQNDEMNKLRNETIFTQPNSPLGKRKISGIENTDAPASPDSLKNKINLNDMKKQIVKLNPSKQETGFVNQIILERNSPINQQLRQEYDAI